MKENVVVQQQDEIRVYENEQGGISILQDDGIGNEQVIWFSPEHAEALCDAIAGLAHRMLQGEE